ncbi:hypothetical protein [uncultured Bacteroides sp.]|nr:hypothetical protein [uncultured Bacteroides sp.]
MICKKSTVMILSMRICQTIKEEQVDIVVLDALMKEGIKMD